MPKWRSTSIAILAAICLAAPPRAALAQVDQGRALAAIESARELARAINAAPEAAAAPRATDSANRDEFAAAVDPGAAGQGAQNAGELALLWDMQFESGELLRAYLLAGAPETERLQPTPGGAVAANFLTFMPEIGRIYDFRMLVGARIAESAMRLLAEGQIGEAAVQALAAEQEKVLAATVTLAGDHQLDPQWRKERLSAAVGYEARFGRLLGRKRAQEVADRALAAAIGEKDETVAAALTTFALAMLR